MSPTERPILSVHDLAVSFEDGNGGRTPAVSGVNMSVHAGQTLAIVGESGSGKSVTAMSVLRLLPSPPAHIERGRIELVTDRLPDAPDGVVDILQLDQRDLRTIRGNEIAMIFQEPMTSLNPVFTIGEQIEETIRLHQRVDRRIAHANAACALSDVGIADPMRCLRSYPHEFSGGMRQRAMIAMALACHPRVLLADEPTTALDATIQAQILTLLRDLQRARALAIVLITHALGIVAQTADVVCVMYAGRVVEYARVLDLFDRPLHLYTRGLLACIPSLASPRDRLATVREFVDDPARFALKDRPGLHAWWPAHRPPDAVRSRANGESEYRLVEIEPGRWLGLWNTPEAHALPASFPNLPPLSAQTVAIGAR